MLATYIPTRIHGILDYLVGLFLIVTPWLFQFPADRPAMLVAVMMGASTIIYSLITNYEMGLVRLIPMKGHLWIDLVAGIFLMVSPWLFGFINRHLWPHVCVGAMEALVVIFSCSVPSQADKMIPAEQH